MSRPHGDVATSFASCFFSSGCNLSSTLQQISSFPPIFQVATSFAICLALLHVASSVSSHNIVCGLIIKWSQLQFSCQDFSTYFHVATYTACRDLNSNLSLKTSCNVFYFRRPLLWLSLTDPRRNLRKVSQHEFLPLIISFCLYHIFFVATSFFKSRLHLFKFYISSSKPNLLMS